MELVEFLLARIAEDEEAARAATPGPEWTADGGDVYAGHPTNEVVDYTDAAEHIARWDPARVLAECEAKRRIVEEYRRDVSGTPSVDAYWHAMVIVAAPYADHPDYREEWRP